MARTYDKFRKRDSSRKPVFVVRAGRAVKIEDVRAIAEALEQRAATNGMLSGSYLINAATAAKVPSLCVPLENLTREELRDLIIARLLFEHSQGAAELQHSESPATLGFIASESAKIREDQAACANGEKT
jgi:hypothetical protein